MEEQKNNNQNIYNILIILLLTMSLVYAINLNNAFKLFGYASIILLLVICFIRIMKNKILLDYTFKMGLIFIVYNISLLIINFSRNALYIVSQEVALILFLIIFIQIKMTENSIEKIINYFSKMYYIGLSVVFICYNLKLTNIVSMTVCKAVFAISFFAMIKTKKKLLFTIFSGVTFFLMGERTGAIIFIVIYILNEVIKRIKKKSIYKLLFIVFSIILIIIPKLYVWMQYQPIGEELNEYSKKISGENFFSGRNRIWKVVYDELEDNKVFGLTYNNNILKDNNINLSTHNLYVWLQMNGGYVLLVLYLIFLYIIWMKFYEYKDNEIDRWSSAYLLGFMLLVNFELLWLSNNFVVSIYMWFVIGFSLVNIKKLDKKY